MHESTRHKENENEINNLFKRIAKLNTFHKLNELLIQL